MAASLIKQSITTVALAGLLFILAFGSFCYLSCAFSNAAVWVSHTHNVHEVLTGIERSIVSIESGARGFVVTGREAFLAPYLSARKELPVQIENLRKLTVDNVQQQRFVGELEKLVVLKETIASGVVEDKRDGSLTNQTLLDMEKGRAAMEKFHLVVAGMRAEENRLLLMRERAFHRLQVALLVTAAFSGVLSVGLLIWLAVLIMANKQSFKYARNLIETSLDPLVTISIDGKITDVNEATILATGVVREKLVGSDFAQYVTEPDRARQGYEKVFQSGFVTDYPLTLRHVNGKLTDVMYNASVYKDSAGKILGVFAAARDVTALKMTESQLAEQRIRLEEGKRSEERLRILLEASPNGVLIIDKDGRLVLVNSRAESIFGYTREELLGDPIDLLVPPSVRTRRPDFVSRLFAKPHPRIVGKGQELFGLRKDGSFVPVEINVNSLEFDGESCVLMSILDVSGRSEVEDKLRAQGQLLDLAYESIMIRDFNGVISYWNRGAQEMYGYTDEEAVGHSAHTLLKTEFPKPLAEINRELLATGRWDGELVHYTAAGKRLDVTSRWALKTERRGDPTVIEITGDITALKNAAELLQRKILELENANAELERSNEDLNQFAYVCSHDLQEPLRTITNFTQLFAQRYPELVDDKAKQFIEFIVGAAKRMQSLINDLLSYSRVERKSQSTDLVNCSTALDLALANLQATIQENQANIQRTRLPVVSGNSSQVVQLFQNLLSNALKFRNAAAPEIHISACKSGQYWRFSVSDNGIGFDMKHAERIFSIFQRLHSRDKYEGTGIGLSICKKIVERHHGRIWVESKPGEGTTFYFTMPSLVDAGGLSDEQYDKSLTGRGQH